MRERVYCANCNAQREMNVHGRCANCDSAAIVSEHAQRLNRADRESHGEHLEACPLERQDILAARGDYHFQDGDEDVCCCGLADELREKP